MQTKSTQAMCCIYRGRRNEFFLGEAQKISPFMGACKNLYHNLQDLAISCWFGLTNLLSTSSKVEVFTKFFSKYKNKSLSCLLQYFTEQQWKVQVNLTQ